MIDRSAPLILCRSNTMRVDSTNICSMLKICWKRRHRVMKQILMIDDDIHINAMLDDVLTKEGYEVIHAYSGTEALLLLKNYSPDLILLDLMLPGLNGEEVLPQIQDIPVIVVSAKAGLNDKVNLLTGGAVDYVTKPFEMEELLARILTHLRQSEKSERNVNKNILSYDDIIMNCDSKQVTAAGENVKLTRTEFAILKLLMRNSGQVIAKSVILDKISLDTPDCTENSLKIHMSNLRRKLKGAGTKDYIEAVWGIGFKMAE